MTTVLYLSTPPKDWTAQEVYTAICTEPSLRKLQEVGVPVGFNVNACRNAVAKTVAHCSHKMFEHIRNVLQEYPKSSFKAKTKCIILRTSDPEVAIRWHFIPEEVLKLYPPSNLDLKSLSKTELDEINRIAAVVLGALYIPPSISPALQQSSGQQSAPLRSVGLCLLEAAGDISPFDQTEHVSKIAFDHPIYQPLVAEAYQEYQALVKNQSKVKKSCNIM